MKINNFNNSNTNIKINFNNSKIAIQIKQKWKSIKNFTIIIQQQKINKN